MAKSFGTPILLPADPASALHAATKQYVDNAAFVPTSRQVIAGTGLTGGGTLAADRTFAVAYGTSNTTACIGDDARLSDTRNPKLNPTATKTTTYTAAANELVMCDDTGGAFTVTLPAAATGLVVGIKKIVSSGNAVTISRAGSDTIGGAAATTVTIRLIDETTILVANGTNWLPIYNWVGVPSLDSRYVRTSVAQTWTAKQTFSIATVSTPVVLTDAATVTVDASLGNHFRLTTTSGVGATRALGSPSNATDGQRILFEIIQDGTGSRALTYNAIYRFGTLVTSPTLTTTASKTDYLGFIYNSAATKWDCLAFAPGY